MQRAVPADAARDDLAALRQEDAPRLRVLVVDLQLFIRAEPAHLVAREHLPAGTAALLLRALRDDFDHDLLLVLVVAAAVASVAIVVAAAAEAPLHVVLVVERRAAIAAAL